MRIDVPPVRLGADGIPMEAHDPFNLPSLKVGHLAIENVYEHMLVLSYAGMLLLTLGAFPLRSLRHSVGRRHPAGSWYQCTSTHNR